MNLYDILNCMKRHPLYYGREKIIFFLIRTTWRLGLMDHQSDIVIFGRTPTFLMLYVRQQRPNEN